jgi:protein-tyrosine kinase
MSIVQSAIERIKKNAGDQDARILTMRTADELPRARMPAPLFWPTQTPSTTLDINHFRALNLYPPEEFVRRQQDEYRSIRREIIAASRERLGPGDSTVGPIVVVTSALPGDGKSYTALNLALSIAGEDVHDVLLIDADTIKRTISIACGVDGRPGLIELLGRPEASFFEYACPTNFRRLRILPSGKRRENATDLFGAERIVPLFDSIRTALAGHIVVIDTPPILLSSETPSMTDAAGQVVLVVRAGHTLQDSVKDAVSRIRQSVPVGVLLNGWSPVLPSERKAYIAYEEYSK